MGKEQQPEFAVKGVVRNGQVELEKPLDVPDGLYVTITPVQDGDVGEEAEVVPLTREQIRWFREHTERIRVRTTARRSGPEAA